MISPPVGLLSYTSLMPPMHATQETTTWLGDGNVACSLQPMYIKCSVTTIADTSRTTDGVKCCDISG